MTPKGPIEEADLHARIDGQLPSERTDSVDAYLAEHPEERVRWSRYAEQRQALRAALALQIGEPIPLRLLVDRLLAEQRQRRQRLVRLVAAAVGFFVMGGVGGWAARDLTVAVALSNPTALAATAARMITADAIAAHRTFSVEVRHPVEVEAGQEAHLVQWLSKRLGRQLVVPDLTAAGFHLMGGRLLPAEDASAAQFMYESDKADRLTLYIRVGVESETGFRYSEGDGIGAFYWSDEGFGYAVAAKADREQLLRLAEIIYRQTVPGGVGGAKIPPASGKDS
jgi:anti-sigma factor RsiW